MKKSLQYLVFGSLFAAIVATSSNANAHTTKAKAADVAKDPAATVKPKRDWYPFYGTVTAVDKSAKTISLKKMEGARVLQTDDKTTFEMNGKPASISDVKAGNYLHGTLHKDAAKEEVVRDAKIEKEAPVRNKGTNHVATAVAPVVMAATPAEDTTNNAVVKAKKKKAKKSSDTNAPAAN